MRLEELCSLVNSPVVVNEPSLGEIALGSPDFFLNKSETYKKLKNNTIKAIESITFEGWPAIKVYLK